MRRQQRGSLDNGPLLPSKPSKRKTKRRATGILVAENDRDITALRTAPNNRDSSARNQRRQVVHKNTADHEQRIATHSHAWETPSHAVNGKQTHQNQGTSRPDSPSDKGGKKCTVAITHNGEKARSEHTGQSTHRRKKKEACPTLSDDAPPERRDRRTVRRGLPSTASRWSSGRYPRAAGSSASSLLETSNVLRRAREPISSGRWTMRLLCETRVVGNFRECSVGRRGALACERAGSN